jgi:predicted TIM-barrel fold metal-dependent hydrolase
VLASEGYVAGLPWAHIAGHAPLPNSSPGVVALIDHAGELFHIEAAPDVRAALSRLLSEHSWVVDYSILATRNERDASALATSIAQRLRATGRRPAVEFDR